MQDAGLFLCTVTNLRVVDLQLTGAERSLCVDFERSVCVPIVFAPIQPVAGAQVRYLGVFQNGKVILVFNVLFCHVNTVIRRLRQLIN